MKHFLFSLMLVCGFVQAQPSTAVSSVTTPHVRAELLAYAPDGVQAGKPLTVGLQMQHQPGWHTYWKNPGDSGLPIQLSWTLPPGIDAGEIQWPAPKKIPVANLLNYGFDGALLLTVPLTVAHTFNSASVGASGDITIGLKAQWLVCKTECIPEEATLSLKLPVRATTAAHRAAFEAAKNNLPKQHLGAASFTPVEVTGAAKTLRLNVQGLPAAWQGKMLDVYPEEGEVVETASKLEQSWAQGPQGGTQGQWTGVLALSAQRTKNPSTMAWLIKIAGNANNPALRLEAKLDGAWQVVPAAAVPSSALKNALAQNMTGSVNAANPASPALAATWLSATFWLAVLGAFAGGLLLNLMPCVLPVLAIKLLSFAPKKVIDGRSSVASIKFENPQMPVIHSDETLSFRASSGLFALGVIGSFAALGVALLALRAAGQSLGWGFQLQSPSMVMGLAVLFLLIGLNLFDAFDVNVLLPRKLANFQANNPSLEALASGALAVLIATPCTAPFMGASLGLAVALPALQALLIFIVLGLGMALPFIVIAAFPRMGSLLLRWLPKPGAWMAVLRHFLAWPVLATVVWLLWVYAQQTSINHAFALVFVLLMGVALMWALRLAKGKLRTVIALVFGLCFAAALYMHHTVAAQAGDGARLPTSTTSSADLETWQPWSANAQQAALAKGQPVFVDFTAAWCITCQVNKSSTLETNKIQALFKAKNVLLLRADWTRPNAAIAAELAKLGRSGLPVYAFYLPGAKVPQLLPELLTTGAVEDALSVL